MRQRWLRINGAIRVIGSPSPHFHGLPATVESATRPLDVSSQVRQTLLSSLVLECE